MKLRFTHSLLIAVFLALIVPASSSFADLLHVEDELELPAINYNPGTVTYDATSDLFSVKSFPVAIKNGGLVFVVPTVLPVIPTGIERFDININVDSFGNASGVVGPDLIVDGYADYPGEEYPIMSAYRDGMKRITVERVLEKVSLAVERHLTG